VNRPLRQAQGGPHAPLPVWSGKVATASALSGTVRYPAKTV
jgi:hypothetical protein